MTEHVKIFLTAEALTELEDQYVDNPQDLRKELQGFVKTIYASVKTTEMNKTLMCQVQEEVDGVKKFTPKQIPFAEIDFSKYKCVHNPEWKPKDIENPGVYELAVGDNTWKKLESSTMYYMIRLEKFNESVEESKKIPVPTCFEEIMFQEFLAPTMNLIMKKITKGCDDEFEQLNKAENVKPTEKK